MAKNESLWDLLFCVLVRLVVVLVLVAIFGTGCKTSGAGQLRAAQINSGLSSASDSLTDLESTIDKSSATPEEKSSMKSKVRSAKEKIGEAKPAINSLGKDADAFQSQAQKNAVDAGRMRLLYWLAGIFGAMFVIYLLRSKLKKIFLPMTG